MPKGSTLLVLAAALGGVLLCGAAAAAADDPAEVAVEAQDAPEAAVDHEDVVATYLKYFFRRTDGRSLKKAEKLIPLVVAAARKENLDPLLVAVIIAYESTWRPKAVGGVGEVGLMQVHGMAAEGFDVTTIEGNLAAGCAWLASRIQMYGSVEAGVAAYIGASDRARRGGAFRVNEYRKAQKRQGLPRS